MDLSHAIQSLPVDLQDTLFQYVSELRKPKRVLSVALQQDIETFWMLTHIRNHFKQLFSTHYEDWVENAIINILNNNQGFTVPLQPRFHAIFPNMTDYEIKFTLLEGNHIIRLWIHTPPLLRIRLYLTTFRS